jgi:BatD DUF11 like domain
MIPDKRNVYAGQQILLTEKEFNHFPIVYHELTYTTESPDFLFENVKRSGSITNQHKDTINGKVFNTTIRNLQTVYPEHEGYSVIKPFSVTALVQKGYPSDPHLYNLDSHVFCKLQAYSLKSNQAVIYVNPLPATNRPFSGLVGTFKVNVSVAEDKVKPGDSIHIEITLIGNGNLKLLNTIPYKFPKDLNPLAPTLSDSTYETENSQVLSNQTFSYVLIPKTPGSFEVSNTEIIYFNPEIKNYTELAIPGFNIEVVNPEKY